MSNHVRMIVRSERGDLSGTIRDLKKFTAKKISSSGSYLDRAYRDRMLASGVNFDLRGVLIAVDDFKFK